MKKEILGRKIVMRTGEMEKIMEVYDLSKPFSQND